MESPPTGSPQSLEQHQDDRIHHQPGQRDRREHGRHLRPPGAGHRRSPWKRCMPPPARRLGSTPTSSPMWAAAGGATTSNDVPWLVRSVKSACGTDEPAPADRRADRAWPRLGQSERLGPYQHGGGAGYGQGAPRRRIHQPSHVSDLHPRRLAAHVQHSHVERARPPHESADEEIGGRARRARPGYRPAPAGRCGAPQPCRPGRRPRPARGSPEPS